MFAFEMTNEKKAVKFKKYQNREYIFSTLFLLNHAICCLQQIENKAENLGY